MARLVATLTFLFCCSTTLKVDVSVACVDTMNTIGGGEGWNCSVSEMLGEWLVKMRRHDCKNDLNKDDVDEHEDCWSHE